MAEQQWQVGQHVEIIDGQVLAGERAVVMADSEGEWIVSDTHGNVWVLIHFERDGQVIDKQQRSEFRFEDRWELVENLRAIE